MLSMFHWAESVSQGQLLWRFQGRICSLPLLVSGDYWHSLTYRYITPISTSIAFSYVCVSNLPLLLRLIVMEFKVYEDHLGWSPHLKILYLITNAKTLFTNKIIFVGSRDSYRTYRWSYYSSYCNRNKGNTAYPINNKERS